MKIRSEKSMNLHSGSNLGQIPVNPKLLTERAKQIAGTIKLQLFTISKLISTRIIDFSLFARKQVLQTSRHVRLRTSRFLENTKTMGITDAMDDYEKRKLGIFNLLNLFQYCTGLLIPVILIVNEPRITLFSSAVMISPPMISIVVLYLNARKKFEAALLTYFILYPFCSSLVYLNGIDIGIELFFVLYGILAVFFLRQLSHILLCIGFCMINYFILAVVLNTYNYNLEFTYRFLFLGNQLLAIGFIFYGLYLIKNENAGYQQGILQTNIKLEKLNQEIKRQKEEITEKASLLEEQAVQLKEMDKFKTRLFSIVSHDLKNPLYALRNLFSEIRQKRIPEKDIIKLLPQVIKDLNYATALTDNLLHWAKSQMQANSIFPQEINVSSLIEEIYQQQRLQAEIKGVQILLQIDEPFIIYADRDMISLVIRNLLSNAIKFTPEKGKVTVGVNDLDTSVEIYVMDTGAGMSAEDLEKIRHNNYFTTRGTSNEPGTGLGLMLVKEFLLKNKGQLHIESSAGQGSTFSFTLPKPISG